MWLLKSGFRICNRAGNLKLISTLRYLFLYFHFNHSIGNPIKDLKNCPYNNSGLARARVISKEKTAVLQILFRISQSNGKKEIHEIWIWIS